MPRWLLIAALILVAIPLGWRAWNLHLLYLNATLRADVQNALNDAADERGWLLSDVSIRSVREEEAVIHHRPHQRGILPPAECYMLAYDPPSLAACAD